MKLAELIYISINLCLTTPTKTFFEGQFKLVLCLTYQIKHIPKSNKACKLNWI